MRIQIKGIKGGRDRRGLVSLTYKFLFTDCDEIEALTGSVPLPNNLTEVNRNIVEWINNTSFMVDVVTEGIVAQPDASEETKVIDGEWREEPIESFPYRDMLEKEYGAYEESGKLKFPQYLESANTGSGLGGSSAQAIENPLYGCKTYPVLRLVASHSYVRENVPSSVYDDPGTVVKTLPSGFDNPPKKTWIIDKPSVRNRGKAWEITRRWKELPDNLRHLEALQLMLQKRRKK